MGGIEDHGIPKRAQDRQRAHVYDEGVVAEARPALGQQQVLVARPRYLLHDVFHVPRGQELPLLDVDHAPALARREEQIRLPGQKGRDLEHVHDLGDGFDLPGLMDVRQNGDAKLGFDGR